MIDTYEGVDALKRFIKGERNEQTKWCDWQIPLHWGGMSDPFQPIERKHKRSLECLKVFAETQYPFVVSTKNKLIAEEPYLSLIKQCNCVIQLSALCNSYDKVERGASTFEQRLETAKAISPFKRVIIRCQPYLPQYFGEILSNIKLFAQAGAYGCIFESMKYQKKHKGTMRILGDFCYPTQLLKRHFSALKTECHKYGLKFYSGENRLRAMGDSLCCCGVDGLGWKVNTANLNHFLYDRDNYKFTEAMKKAGTAFVFKSLAQNAASNVAIKGNSYKSAMEIASKAKGVVGGVLPDDVRAKL